MCWAWRVTEAAVFIMIVGLSCGDKAAAAAPGVFGTIKGLFLRVTLNTGRLKRRENFGNYY